MKNTIKDAVLFGMGYVCGKHNLTIKKNEREKIAKGLAKELTVPLSKEDKKSVLLEFKSYWKNSSHQNIDDAVKGFLRKIK